MIHPNKRLKLSFYDRDFFLDTIEIAPMLPAKKASMETKLTGIVRFAFARLPAVPKLSQIDLTIEEPLFRRDRDVREAIVDLPIDLRRLDHVELSPVPQYSDIMKAESIDSFPRIVLESCSDWSFYLPRSSLKMDQPLYSKKLDIKYGIVKRVSNSDNICAISHIHSCPVNTPQRFFLPLTLPSFVQKSRQLVDDELIGISPFTVDALTIPNMSIGEVVNDIIELPLLSISAAALHIWTPELFSQFVTPNESLFTSTSNQTRVSNSIKALEWDIASTRRIEPPPHIRPPSTCTQFNPTNLLKSIPILHSSLLSWDPIEALRKEGTLDLEGPLLNAELVLDDQTMKRLREVTTVSLEIEFPTEETIEDDDETIVLQDLTFTKKVPVIQEIEITPQTAVTGEMHDCSVEKFSAQSAIAKYLLLRGHQVNIPVSKPAEIIVEKPLKVVALVVEEKRDFLNEHCLDFQRLLRPQHKYIASSAVLMRKSLLGHLERDFSIDIVERELASCALVLDCKTILVLVPYSHLPLTDCMALALHDQLERFASTDLGNLMGRLASHFSKIHIVFEKITGEGKVRVDPFTPPIRKALDVLDLFLFAVIRKGFGADCHVWCSTNDLQSSCIIRKCGDACSEDMEDRNWISDSASKQELFLTNFPGLNHFSAQLLLNKHTLSQIAMFSIEVLHRKFSKWIPSDRLVNSKRSDVFRLYFIATYTKAFNKLSQLRLLLVAKN